MLKLHSRLYLSDLRVRFETLYHILLHNRLFIWKLIVSNQSKRVRNGTRVSNWHHIISSWQYCYWNVWAIRVKHHDIVYSVGITINIWSIIDSINPQSAPYYWNWRIETKESFSERCDRDANFWMSCKETRFNLVNSIIGFSNQKLFVNR